MQFEQKTPKEKASYLDLYIERADGKREWLARALHNSRTDEGASWMYNQLTGQGSPGAGIYIALSSASQTIVKGMTSLTSELSGDGLDRASATIQNYTAPASLDGSASYELTKTFIYTGASPQTVASVGIFDASSAGSLIWVFNASASRTLNQNDKLVALVTVNI